MDKETLIRYYAKGSKVRTLAKKANLTEEQVLEIVTPKPKVEKPKVVKEKPKEFNKVKKPLKK